MKIEVFFTMYDYIIVTHIPAFYKVNLYNELAKKLNIFVVFIASNTSEKRSDDFVTLEDAKFHYAVLHHGNFQERDVFQNIKKLRMIFQKISFKRLLLSGWDLGEFWYLVMTQSKTKNCLALESTIMESNPKGFKGLIKKIFLSRITTVFASGCLHVKLLESLGYNREIKLTNGVGIINKPVFAERKRDYRKRFLYIGRFSSVKNLKLLIAVFNELSEYSLTLIGDGEEVENLKSLAKQNIIFKESIENKKLQEEFLGHDVFILPSLSEPWGLVVEEALYFGLPVIVSSQCGASELIKDEINGYVINPYAAQSLKKAILNFNNQAYEKLLNGVSHFSIVAKDMHQVKAYL